MSRAAMQQALDAIEDSGCKADLMAAADALRAALAEQSQPVAWRYKPMAGSPWWSLSEDGYYVSCKRDNGYIVQPLYTTPPAPIVPQPLTELPPLPAPVRQHDGQPLFGAGQMRDYARAVEAEVIRRMGVQR